MQRRHVRVVDAPEGRLERQPSAALAAAQKRLSQAVKEEVRGEAARRRAAAAALSNQDDVVNLLCSAARVVSVRVAPVSARTGTCRDLN
jgi:predicted neuraminidase